MYLKNDVLPTFEQWVRSQNNPVLMADAKRLARGFLLKHVNPASAHTRGAVYELFENVANYADTRLSLYGNRLDQAETLCLENMHVLARGIVWAVEHDGFDQVKYDPITQWGKDIHTAAM